MFMGENEVFISAHDATVVTIQIPRCRYINTSAQNIGPADISVWIYKLYIKRDDLPVCGYLETLKSPW